MNLSSMPPQAPFPRNLLRLCAIAVGGGIGALLRFGLQRWFGYLNHSGHHVDRTLQPLLDADLISLGIINVVGCVLIGAFSAHVNAASAPVAHAFVVTGLLGGFTSFSAFIGFLSNARSVAEALVYVLFSFASCVAGVAIGRSLVRLVSSVFPPKESL